MVAALSNTVIEDRDGIVQRDYISYSQAMKKGLTKAHVNKSTVKDQDCRKGGSEDAHESKKNKQKSSATRDIDCLSSVALPHSERPKDQDRSSKEFFHSMCGRDSCLPTPPMSETGAPEGYNEHRQSSINIALEKEACRLKEAAAFRTPKCLGWESLSLQKGFRFCKGGRIPNDGKKYLVRGCTVHFKSQRLKATKLPCCTNWHFEPVEVILFIPQEGVQLNASLDHVGFTRLLDIEPQRFWNEHDFESEETKAEMCKKKQAAFKRVAEVKDVTALLKNCGDGNTLISALLMFA